MKLCGRGPIALLTWLAGMLLHISCTESTAPVIGDPAGINIVSGDFQAAVVGQQLSSPLVVLVVDADSRPVAGATVQFTAAGGGSLTPTTTISLPNGTARTTWVLGKRVAEPQRVQARLTGGGAAASVVFSATARPGPATTVVMFAGDGQRRPPGVALRDSIAAQVRDQYGNTIPDVQVWWRVTAGGGVILPATSITDTGGVARAAWTVGATVGGNAAEATVDGISERALFSAQTVPAPAITNISPAVLVPGEIATITGTNFGSIPSEFAVAFNHSAASIEYGDSTQIRVIVPCEPSGPVAVEIQVNGAATHATHMLAVADPVALSLGESRLFDAGEVCRELAGGGRYLLAVVNPDAGTSTSSFRLRGGTADDTPPSVFAAIAAAGARRPSAPHVNPTGRGHHHAHARLLDASRRLVERLGVPRAASSAGGTLSSSAATIALNDTMMLKIPNAVGNLCTVRAQVRGRVVFAGTRAVILEDVAAPLAGTMDDIYRSIGDEFEAIQWGIVASYFGNPLAFDAQTDRNGRIYMLFSKVVNDFESSAAFTSSGDFYPATSCAASNGAEVFYGIVPTQPVRGYGEAALDNPDNWHRTMRSVVIHEVKHITAFAEKFARNGSTVPNIEERWLEEGTAVVAEELFARAVYGYRWRSNVTFQESLFCETRPDPMRHPAECWHKPLVMHNYFGLLSEFLSSMESLSPLGPALSSDDVTFYGSAWSLLRWAADQFAADEPAFFRALVQERTLRGVSNLEARTGRPLVALLGDWTIASMLDDDPDLTAAQPVHSIPSWNSRDIYRRLHEEEPAYFPRPVPLSPRRLPTGSFSVTVEAVRAGSATLLDLYNETAQPKLVHLSGEAGAAQSEPTVRLQVVRIE